MIPAVGTLIEAKFFCTAPTQNGINALHYVVTALTGSGVDDADIATALSTLAGPLYRNYLPISAAYAGLRLQVIRPNLQPTRISTAGAAGGSIAGDSMPFGVSGLISTRTLQVGRRSRGRIYLPFWTETHNDPVGKPTAAALGLMGTWATAMLNPIVVTAGANTTTVAPVVWSRTGLLSFGVTSFVIRTQWATQRRRSQITKPDVLGPGV